MAVMTPILKSSPVIKRYENNPVLSKEHIPYDATLIFNAGVAKYNGKYVMIFRDDMGFTDELPRFGGTHLGLATSDDGIKWDVSPKPFLSFEEMKTEGSDHVWLSFENMSKEMIFEHFPNIYKTCLEAGYNIVEEPIPVVPAQHYFMGGIHVDIDSKTTMDHLYAVGETSCNGVHGKNRLASNSLLESLVFAKRAAIQINKHREER